MSDSSAGDYSRSTPPTEPPARTATSGATNWPNVLGIIGIVFGAGGFLMGIFSVLSTLFFESIFRSFDIPADADAKAFNEAMDVSLQWMIWTVPISIAGAMLALVLLFAGILLLKRRAVSVKTFRIWAGAKIVLTVIGAVLSLVIQRSTLAAMPVGLPAAFGTAIELITMVFALAWGLALPVFALIWFARAKVQAEVSRWT